LPVGQYLNINDNARILDAQVGAYEVKIEEEIKKCEERMNAANASFIVKSSMRRKIKNLKKQKTEIKQVGKILIFTRNNVAFRIHFGLPKPKDYTKYLADEAKEEFEKYIEEDNAFAKYIEASVTKIIGGDPDENVGIVVSTFKRIFSSSLQIKDFIDTVTPDTLATKFMENSLPNLLNDHKQQKIKKLRSPDGYVDIHFSNFMNLYVRWYKSSITQINTRVEMIRKISKEMIIGWEAYKKTLVKENQHFKELEKINGSYKLQSSMIIQTLRKEYVDAKVKQETSGLSLDEWCGAKWNMMKENVLLKYVLDNKVHKLVVFDNYFLSPQ
jgi:RNase H-fold protein (predicted Holliday junction resolvase)